MAHDTTCHFILFRPGLRSAQRSFVLLVGLLLLMTVAGGSAHSASSLAQASVAAQGEKDVRLLELGKAIERELAGGQQHAYQITLSAGRYLNVVVEQRGIDVVEVLFGPDGKQLIETDNGNGAQGPETLTWITAADGQYRIEIRPFKKDADVGHYEISMVELRAATEDERALFTASQELEQLGNQSKFAEAIPVAERILALQEKMHGPDHPEVVAALSQLALLYMTKGDAAKAEPLLLRALAILEKAVGPDHAETLALVTRLALVARVKGDLARAESLLQRVLAAKEKTFGPEDPNVISPLLGLSNFYTTAKVDLVKAESLLQRALTIGEKQLPPDHPDLFATLAILAQLYQVKADYAQAEPLLRRMLAIQEKKRGPEDGDVGLILVDLATVYLMKADYDEAEPLYRRALAIQEKAFGPEYPLLYFVLDNLGIVYLSKGDYAQAEPLFQRAQAVIEKAYGPENGNLIFPLSNLALIAMVRRDFARAESFYQRVLALNEKALGPEHPNLAFPLSGLASIYLVRGEYARAEPLYQRALTISEKAYGPEHPSVALMLIGVGSFYLAKGDYAQAERVLQRALAISEKAFGSEHFNIVRALQSLAQAQQLKGDLPQAIALLTRSNEISERFISQNLSGGSERQKLALLAALSPQTANTLAFHALSAPNNPAALSLALTTLLQRKGRGLDVMTDAIAQLRRRATPEDQKLLDQLAAARSQLAAFTLKDPGQGSLDAYRAQLKQLTEQVEKLESDISARNAEFRVQTQPITLTAVQAAIPDEAALVEFAFYAPPDFKTFGSGPPRYAAYVLSKQGEPRWVDLGAAAQIDQMVETLRQALRNPKRTDFKTLARKLDEQVMRPVRALLGPTKRVFISPDGALNLVPFAALVDERGQYLVTRYAFNYLTSGRDLLRLQVRVSNRQKPLVVADPDFGGEAATGAGRILTYKSKPSATAAAAPTNAFSQFYFPPLPGTATEGKALRAILPEATFLTQRQATKAALKGITGPALLHIATHGFFLEDLNASADAQGAAPLGVDPARGLSLVGGGSTAIRVENPLLRSGLALAGANEHRADDDGILTALEVSGLDLSGTKLVVLSACDTGVGEVKNGDGVYGLRRALVLAGSETQVMSLWPVSDKGTRDLMIAYYQALERGEGRSAALRNVQLQMLKSEKQNHPYYWASFIQSGEWANLQGQR